MPRTGIDHARWHHMRHAALRNAADPARLAKAVRVVQAGLDLGLVSAADVLVRDDDDR